MAPERVARSIGSIGSLKRGLAITIAPRSTGSKLETSAQIVAAIFAFAETT